MRAIPCRLLSSSFVSIFLTAGVVIYGKEDASDEEVDEAVRVSALEALVKSMPDGLETLVGERGMKLSGGERQRVGLARCVIKQPKLVLLDEVRALGRDQCRHCPIIAKHSNHESSSRRRARSILERRGRYKGTSFPSRPRFAKDALR